MSSKRRLRRHRHRLKPRVIVVSALVFLTAVIAVIAFYSGRHEILERIGGKPERIEE